MRRCLCLTIGVSMVLASASVATAQEDAKAPKAQNARGELPSAMEIIEAHVEARGGREALQTNASYLRTGTVDLPTQGRVSNVIEKRMAPNLLWIELSNTPRGTRIGAHDGEFFWTEDDVMGPVPIDPLTGADRNFDYYADLNYPTYFDLIETVDRTTLEGRDVYKVRLVTGVGNEMFEYFDIETKLRFAAETRDFSTAGELVTIETYPSWMELDGLMFPDRVVTLQEAPGSPQQVITSIEYDHYEIDTLTKDDFAMSPETRTVLGVLPPAPADREPEQDDDER